MMTVDTVCRRDRLGLSDLGEYVDDNMKIMVIAPTEDISLALTETGGDAVDVSWYRRHPQAVRTLDQTAPDVVIIGMGLYPAKTSLLIQALRQRAFGALIAIILVDKPGGTDHLLATPSGAAEAGADRFVGPGASAAAVLSAAADVCHIDLPIVMPSEDTAEDPDVIERSKPLFAPRQSPPTERSVQMHTQLQGLDPVSEISRPAPPADPHETINLQALRRKLRQVRHEDYFTILEVRKSADEQSVLRAHRRLRSSFSPANLPRALADRYFTELREICDALDDAKAVLGSELRATYVKSLLQLDRAVGI